jgi:phosphatidylglycerophosphatase C
MNIAFFDFDGTITTDDSLIGFIRFAVGNLKFIIGMGILSPILLGYTLKLIPNYRAKQIILAYFFKGIEAKKFTDLAQEYSLQHIPKILRPQAMEKIQWHLDNNDRVVVVSASIECWLLPWCEQHNLELLATKLEMAEGRVTGKFQTKNCYGIEKVHRIREKYDLHEYESVYAYGDSRGDREMLTLADKKFYKHFISE